MAREPRTLDELYARLPRVTATIFGVTSHLREVDDSESPGTGLLAAFEYPGGTLLLRPSAARRLRRLVEGAPVATPGLRRLIATDLLTLLHESIHALGPSSAAAMRQSFGSARTDADRAVAEGLVEWAAQRHLGEFIRALGVDRRNPWLPETPAQPAYSVPTAMMAVLVEHVAGLSGTDVTAQTAELLRAGVPGGALALLSRRWAAASGVPDAAPRVHAAILAGMDHALAHAVPAEAARLSARRLVARIDAAIGVRVSERSVA